MAIPGLIHQKGPDAHVPISLDVDRMVVDGGRQGFGDARFLFSMVQGIKGQGMLLKPCECLRPGMRAAGGDQNNAIVHAQTFQ